MDTFSDMIVDLFHKLNKKLFVTKDDKKDAWVLTLVVFTILTLMNLPGWLNLPLSVMFLTVSAIFSWSDTSIKIKLSDTFAIVIIIALIVFDCYFYAFILMAVMVIFKSGMLLARSKFDSRAEIYVAEFLRKEKIPVLDDGKINYARLYELLRLLAQRNNKSQ